MKFFILTITFIGLVHSQQSTVLSILRQVRAGSYHLYSEHCIVLGAKYSLAVDGHLDLPQSAILITYLARRQLRVEDGGLVCSDVGVGVCLLVLFIF